MPVRQDPCIDCPFYDEETGKYTEDCGKCPFIKEVLDLIEDD